MSPTRASPLLAAGLATAYWFGGDLERAAEMADLALDIGEALAIRKA